MIINNIGINFAGGGGGSDAKLESKDYNLTANGSTAIHPSSGYDGISGGTIQVNVDMQPAYNSGYTEGYASGYTSGETDGYATGYASGYTSGETDGYATGYASGETVGYASGETAGMAEQKALLTSTTITDNGSYTRENGWNAITVNVPQIGGNRLNMLLNNQLTALTSADLSGVTEIKQSFAYNCTNLVSVDMPSGVTNIGDYAFQNCGLTGLTLPSAIQSISYSSFAECTGITGSLNMSQYTDLIYIGGAAFAGCSGITSLTLPPNLTNLGNSAFDNLSISGEVVVPAGVTSIEDVVFSRTAVSKLTYMGSISGIGWSPWYDMPNLAVIDLTHNFNVLEMSNFDVFNYIDPNFEVWVPDVLYNDWLSAWTESYGDIDWTEHLVSKPSPYGLSYIYYTTNDGNPVDVNLEELNYNPADWGMAIALSNVYDASTGGTITFYGNLTKTQYNFLSDKTNLATLTIPSGVTEISGSFCQSCSNLETVSLPSTVTSIGSGFLSWSGIKTFTTPTGLTSISGSFYMCRNLTSVTITSGVTDIGGFQETSGLKEITIEAPAPYINDYTFSNVNSLETLRFTTSAPPVGSTNNVLSRVPQTGTIYIPAGSLGSYQDWIAPLYWFSNWTFVEE